MAETSSVVITAALIGAAGAIIAALIVSSGNESTLGVTRPALGDSRTNFSDEFSDGSPQVTPGPTFPTIQPPLPTTRLRPAWPSISLSRDSGPVGTVVLVSGEGFAPGERILLYLHTEQIGETKADDAGKFSGVAVTIPASFANFTSQWSVTAEGRGDSGLERSFDERFTITP